MSVEIPQRVLRTGVPCEGEADGGMLVLTKTKAELEAEPQEGMLTRETTPWIQKATTSVSGIGTSEELLWRYLALQKPILCLKKRFGLVSLISW